MFARLNRGLLSTVNTVTWTLAGVLVTLVFANVVARYVFATGVLWAEEVSRLLFVWMVFLGAYIAMCRRGHMAIVFVIERLPPRQRRWLTTIVFLLVLTFLVVVGYAGGRLVESTFAFGRRTPILGISAAWAYLSVPVACCLMTLETVNQLLDYWRSPPDVGDEVSHAETSL